MKFRSVIYCQFIHNVSLGVVALYRLSEASVD